MNHGLLAFFAVFLLALLPSSTLAAEMIHSYHTQIKIENSGDILVRETIEVTAEGKKIKRGLFRDLPEYRRTFLGGRLPTEYQILSLKRDGQREDYHTEITDESILRVYFGRSSYYLPKGQRYVYEFIYRVKSQVFFYDDFDELNWNVIGTGWDFPIMSGSAEIILPDRASVGSYAVYTGRVLSKGSDFEAQPLGNRLAVRTTKPLEPGEGMTVAVSWPIGHVVSNDEMTGMPFFWRQHAGLFELLIGFMLMVAYYYYAWNKVGRDPASIGMTPFYTPPKNISPAMAAYIQSMGDAANQRCMTAAIVSLASKGYLEIEEIRKKKYRITRAAEADRFAKISEDEQILFDAIGTSTTLGSSSKKMIEASDKFNKKLDELCRKRYFFKNSWWWFAGIIPFVLTAIYLAVFEIVHGNFWFGALFMFVFGGVSLGVFIWAVKSLFFSSGMNKAQAFFLIIWSSGFSIGGFLGLFIASTAASWLVIGLCLIMLAFFVLMRVPMKAPTRDGQRIIEHINGLQYYMESVEEDVLKVFDPPQMSRELYEKYLPYAVALGVESKWADKFALAVGGTLAASAAAVSTSPHWYSSSNRFSSGGFSASSMVNSVGGALSAASTSSSSSGGGSSGGGGGGGGGGGW